MKKKILAILCAVCIVLTTGLVTVSASQASTSLMEFDYITSAKPGNIFSGTDTIAFTQNIKNKANESVVSEYSWDITNEAGTSVASYSGSDTLGAKATAVRNITINNPGKYGIYTITVSEENYKASAPGTTGGS